MFSHASRQASDEDARTGELRGQPTPFATSESTDIERRGMSDHPTEEFSEVQAVDNLHRQYQELRTQLGGVIVGLEDVIEQLLVAIMCRGHCILEGMPGLAKTLLVSTLSSVLQLKFRRIQFTPDLMPADITGTDVLEEDRTTGRRVRSEEHTSEL